MSIEVQKIPGEFTFPSVWPKLAFSNLNKMVMDWWADDLDLGALTTPWLDRVNDVELVPMSGNTWSSPTVVTGGAGGHQAVKFDGVSRLSALRTMKQSMAISIVYKLATNAINNERLLSGKQGFRSLLTAGMTTTQPYLAAQVATAPSAAVNTRNANGVVPGTWQSIVLSHSMGGMVAVQNLNGAMSSQAASTAEIIQDEIIIGYNTAPIADPAVNNAGLHGEISRITVWDMGLTNVEIDAMNKKNKKLFALQ